MNTIILNSNHIAKTTVVSNIFIDSYMPCANGEYVKVYIYLLRCMSDLNCDFSISFMAEQLDSTETDIIRALHYWEKEGLVSLRKDEQGQIVEITLLDVKHVKAEPLVEETQKPAPMMKTFMSEVATTVVEEPKNIVERPTYTEAQIAELTNTEEIKWLMNIIEVYLQRLLKPTDVQLILYLYETLGFSAELIMHLYEYCISKNKRHPSYIEAVAISWANEGIDTIEKADTSIIKYNKTYQAVNKAFGLGRQPGQVEQKIIDKWVKKLGFDDNIIVEACNRTLLGAKKPDFNYADSILESWYKNGVKKYADIAALDAKHAERKKMQANTPIKHEAKPNPKNQFNNFQQRNYSKEYISDLEQRLLNK